ncbi:MAG: glycosyltransferase family 4 protein [Planctomycetota bacterium]
MKIGFVSQPFDLVLAPAPNSIGIWLREVARRLAAAGDVIVYTRGRLRKRTEVLDGVRYRTVPRALDEMTLRLVRPFARFLDPRRPFYARDLYHLGYALQIALDLRRERCDVIHVHNFSQFVPLVRTLNRRAKIVLHMHCEWLTQLDGQLIESRLRHADGILACSEFITERIRKRFGSLGPSIGTLHNGVDVGRFAVEPRERCDGSPGRLLFVGRLSPEKGLHVLLEAFQRVLRERPAASLRIVGASRVAPREFIVRLSDDPRVQALARFYQGSYLEHLRGLADSAGADRITFEGDVAHGDLAPFYRSCDALVVPSVWDEPFGMPCVEAMAAGVPVVASRAGGIPEAVLDGETGLLVERDGVEALTRALLQLLGHDDQRTSMGRAGRQRAVQCFSWEVIVERLSRLYRELG